jgi:hypothetical protein
MLVGTPGQAPMASGTKGAEMAGHTLISFVKISRSGFCKRGSLNVRFAPKATELASPRNVAMGQKRTSRECAHIELCTAIKSCSL